MAPGRSLPLAALLLATAAPAAAADAGRGEQLYEQRCGACHGLDADRVGPRHRGVFGRVVGSIAGFAYSPALLRARMTWNDKTLDAWLADPERLLPGQRMGYSVPDAADRADIIAFLRQVSLPPGAEKR